eukprot:gene4059-4719_t
MTRYNSLLTLLVVVGCLASVAVADNYIQLVAFVDLNKDGVMGGADPYYGVSFALTRPDDLGFHQDVVSPSSSSGNSRIVDNLQLGTYCLTPMNQPDPVLGPLVIGPLSNNNQFDPAIGRLCVTFTATTKFFVLNLALRKPDFLVVSGLTWFDTDGNGNKLAAEPFYGIDVTLFKEDKVTVVGTITTNSTVGTYQFNTVPGKYCIRMIDLNPLVIPTKVAQNKIPANGFYCFTGAVDKTVVVDGGFRFMPQYDVSGYTWIDTDGNGAYATTEQYIPIDVTVYQEDKTTLVTSATITWNDANANGAHETAETAYGPVMVSLLKVTVVDSAITPTTDGAYNFQGVAPGDYCIKMSADPFTKNTPLGIAYFVQGTTFIEKDGNGIKNATDPYYGPVQVILYLADKTTVVANAVSPATEVGYKFKVHPGQYCIHMQATEANTRPTTQASTATIEIEDLCNLNANHAGAQYCFNVNEANTNNIRVDFE